MQLLFILLARKGGVGPESLVPQALIIGTTFYFIVLYYGTRNVKDISNSVYIFLFFVPVATLFYQEGYAFMAALGMICGCIMTYGIYLGTKKPDNEN